MLNYNEELQKVLDNLEGGQSAVLKEYFWLISRGRYTEKEFVENILHRGKLLSTTTFAAGYQCGVGESIPLSQRQHYFDEGHAAGIGSQSERKQEMYDAGFAVAIGKMVEVVPERDRSLTKHYGITNYSIGWNACREATIAAIKSIEK